MNTPPDLLDKAVAWAQRLRTQALCMGAAAHPDQQNLAALVGVTQVQRIRILRLPMLPRPDDTGLIRLCNETGMFRSDNVALTLGYEILVAEGHDDRQRLSHEFRHVYQFEKAGSLREYLRKYIVEILIHGYAQAPMERDARAHEITNLQ